MAPAGRTSVFVGRDGVLGRLDVLLAQLATGRGSTLAVSGDAGIGKTRLTTELEARASGLGFLRGACTPEDRSVPSAWVCDLLRRLASDPGEAEPILAEAAPAFVDQVPELRRFAATATARHGLSDIPVAQRLAHVLRRLASLRPTVVVAEDLHWSDGSGVAAFLAAARVTLALPVLLVATYRAPEASLELEEALAHLDRERLVEDVVLPPLAFADVERMVRGLVSPAAVDPLLLRRLHDLTEGNPFFVEEVVAQLVRPGGAGLDLAALTHVPVPRALRVTVRRGMNQLSDRARAVLEAASVVGQRFSVPMLAAVSGTPEERVVACLSEALAAGLVTELSADDFAFRHALTREAVYEIVIGWERRRLHRVIAEVLDRAELDGPATRAARSDHWYRAEVWDRALDSALDAAASALERSAPGAAAELFDRAEEAARRFDVEVPLPLLRGRGRALEMLGAFERSRADLEAAARRAAAAGDAVLTSETQLDLGWLWSSRDYGRAGDHFRSALAVARDSGDDVTLARTLNRVGNWHLVSEQPLDALSRHDEALGLFRRARDERGIAQSLDLMATVELTLGDAGGASRSYLAALDRFRALDDKQGMASSLVMLTFCGPQYLNGPNGAPGPGVAERLAWGDEGLRLTQSIAWRSGQVVAMLGLASVLGYHGKLSDALAHAERATSQAEEIDHQYWRTLGHLIVGAVHLDTLAVERALPSLETAFRLAQQAGSLYWSRITAGFLVPTLLGSGQSERAREIVAVVGGGPDDEPPTDTRGMTMGQRHAWLACAELALADGAAERALAITTALEPPPGSAPLALLDLRGRILEALDRPDDALAVWQRALASARGAGVLSQVWRFEARMSRALRRAGRRAEAAEHLGAAWAVLDRLAAELPAAESNRFTRAARAGVPTTTEREQRKERFDGLTDREREVAVWVARGATNAEIARALSVSSRTVEKHVEHAMAKLGVSSRVRLASWALGHPADDGKGT